MVSCNARDRLPLWAGVTWRLEVVGFSFFMGVSIDQKNCMYHHYFEGHVQKFELLRRWTNSLIEENMLDDPKVLGYVCNARPCVLEC
jgi:hypothetical protein